MTQFTHTHTRTHARTHTSSRFFLMVVVMLLFVAKKMERFCDSSSANASTLPRFRIPSALEWTVGREISPSSFYFIPKPTTLGPPSCLATFPGFIMLGEMLELWDICDSWWHHLCLVYRSAHTFRPGSGGYVPVCVVPSCRCRNS